MNISRNNWQCSNKLVFCYLLNFVIKYHNKNTNGPLFCPLYCNRDRKWSIHSMLASSSSVISLNISSGAPYMHTIMLDTAIYTKTQFCDPYIYTFIKWTLTSTMRLNTAMYKDTVPWPLLYLYSHQMNFDLLRVINSYPWCEVSHGVEWRSPNYVFSYEIVYSCM